MATKLKNLKIKKVDFVDEGANPDAHIKMVKSKNGGEQPVGEKGTGNILKRIFGFIGKAAGMNQEEIDSAMEEIQKGDSVSFNEKFNEAKNRKIADEIWDICYALQSSLYSILNDEDLDSTDTARAMKESLDEFHTVVQECINQWSDGKESNIVSKNEEVSEAELDIMKSAIVRLNESIEKAVTIPKEPETINDNSKGEKEEMKIDKSKLTDAERAFLDSIEKRCSVDDGAGASAVQEPATQVPEKPNVTKSVTQVQGIPEVPAVPIAPETPEQDNIYKGLHPAVAAELEELKKFKQAAEDRELSEVAKKYAIIGKKEEELVPLFKSLKAAGDTAYNDMIAMLDATVAAVNQSGVFSEVGKSGHGSAHVSDAEGKIEGIAKGYMEKEPSLNYTDALAKAWENNPELMDAYDSEEGF